MNEQLTADEITPLLKTDRRGWDIKLFEEETKMSTCVCANCNGICCDAVELGCDHEDDDIFLYCNGCLNDLITTNDNKCPINKHNNPNIVSNRSIRKQISKAIVTCPYSITFKSKGIQMDGNANVVDTMGGYDEKDANEGQNLAVYQQQVYGNEQPLKQNNFCSWRGTLTELINAHFVECTKSNNPTFRLNKRIKELENQCTVQQLKIEKLTTEVTIFRSTNKGLEMELETYEMEKDEQKSVNWLATVNELQSLLEQSQKQVSEWQEKLQEERHTNIKQLHATKEKTDKLFQQIEQLKGLLSDQQHQQEMMEQEEDELKNKIKELETLNVVAADSDALIKHVVEVEALLKQKEKELEAARKREKELLEQLATQETVFRIQLQELGQMTKQMKQREQVREKQQVEAYRKLLKEREARIAKNKERKRKAGLTSFDAVDVEAQQMALMQFERRKSQQGQPPPNPLLDDNINASNSPAFDKKTEAVTTKFGNEKIITTWYYTGIDRKIHVVILRHNTKTMEDLKSKRVIVVDGKCRYAEQSKETHFIIKNGKDQLKLNISLNNYGSAKGFAYAYQLFINDVPFTQLHNNYLNKISGN